MRGKDQEFEKRALELAELFGISADSYDGLDELHRDFFESIGYTRVCAMMVINDLKKGRTEMVIARKYNLTRQEVRTIKSNSSIGEARRIRIERLKGG